MRTIKKLSIRYRSFLKMIISDSFLAPKSPRLEKKNLDYVHICLRFLLVLKYEYISTARNSIEMSTNMLLI